MDEAPFYESPTVMLIFIGITSVITLLNTVILLVMCNLNCDRAKSGRFGHGNYDQISQFGLVGGRVKNKSERVKQSSSC